MAIPQSAADSWWAWATGVLNGIGAPTTGTNYQSLWNWSLKESGANPMSNGLIRNNPLNLEQRSGVPWTGSQIAGIGNSVVSFSDPGVSARATATNLTYYPSILNALKNSVPTSQWASSPAIGQELGTWGSGTNWLHNNSQPPTASQNPYNLLTGFGSSLVGGEQNNPVSDALGAALGPVGGAISGAEQDLAHKALYVFLIMVGVAMMILGLIFLAILALKATPAPVKNVAKTAANLTPQGRAVNVAAAARPRAKPAAPAPKAGPTPISAGGRVIELSPERRRDLEARMAAERKAS